MSTSLARPKVLLVGAGAVGQVYGRHLQLGGAEVSFYVRPKYVEECQRGFALYPLNRRNPRDKAERFTADGVLTDMAQVASRKWDMVFLCVSSTALRAGDWVEKLLGSIGEATLITLQPGLEDYELLAAKYPKERIVAGMISLISYHAPLPGERVPESGMAYWFPPLSPSPFSGSSGNEERAREVVRALNAGGLPAKVVADVPKMVAFPSAMLMTLIAALEASEWSFDKLKHSQRLETACMANDQAMQVIAKKLGAKPPFSARFVKPFFVRRLVSLAPRFVPLDLETYLRAHFTKVGDQTRLFLRTYIANGKKQGQPVLALETLLSSVRDAAI